MFRRFRFVAVSAACALLVMAAPAHSGEECFEVLQYKHCLEP